MGTFVLVHGSWHGAWCWERLFPRLQAAGHTVIAVDLPGYGEDHTPVRDITLQAYADKVLAAVDAAEEPVVLVGHSMGGIVISTVAEQRPERIAHLVYLAAFMLPRGVIPLQFVQTTPEFYEASRLLPYQIFEPDEGIHRVASDGVRDSFLNDANDADVAWVIKRLQHDYLAPLGTPVQVSAQRWGSIPRTYIETLHDQAMPIAAQRKMQQLSPGATVHSLATGHSPLITRPDETADLLLTATTSIRAGR
ncbi:MAG: alpha/beta fold hydrolase [Pseudonocardiaceae bacterium]